MSLEEVKVSRKDVLEIVKDNKKKHDAIFKDAVEGFWSEAEKFLRKYEKDQISAWEKDHKDRLKKMRKQLRDNKKSLKEQVRKELDLVSKRQKDGPFIYMKNQYPENHADDYIGTIRRLELSVDDEVKLDTDEFDKYIRNKWEWRDRFLTSNSGYVTSYYSTFGSGSCYPITGSWALSSSYASTPSYAIAQDTISNF